MAHPTYRFGDDFELDPASRVLRRLDERIALPPKSFECLAYLVACRDRAVGRDELIAAVWGRVEVSDTVVSQTLLRARKAVGDSGNLQRIVRTVPRFGYQWVAPVRETSRSNPIAEHAVSRPPATVQQPVQRLARAWQGWWSLILLVIVAAIAGLLLPGKNAGATTDRRRTKAVEVDAISNRPIATCVAAAVEEHTPASGDQPGRARMSSANVAGAHAAP